jgi:hypothetical protein
VRRNTAETVMIKFLQVLTEVLMRIQHFRDVTLYIHTKKVKKTLLGSVDYALLKHQ